MNRKKEIIIYVILIPLLLFSFLRLGEYRFSAEGVFYAWERGLGYGPSEKILGEYELVEGGKTIIGKCEGNLSVVTAKREFGLFWKHKSGGITCFLDCEKVVTAFLFDGGSIIGLSSNPEINEIYCRIEYGDGENPSIQEARVTVNQGGFILGEWKDLDNEDIHKWIVYVEGRNKSGEVIYQDGMTVDGVYYNNGTKENRE